MQKGRVYLCGAINSKTDSECRDWREAAKEMLEYETLDPMRRDYRGKEDLSVNEIVWGDLADIRDSTFVLVNASCPSWGTAMELVYAFKSSKLIFAFMWGGKISPWLRYHCTQIHEGLVEACHAINRYEQERLVSERNLADKELREMQRREAVRAILPGQY